MFSPQHYFDSSSVSAELQHLLKAQNAWNILAQLDDFLRSVRDERLGRIHPTAVVEGHVYLHPSAEIGPHCFIKGPAWIGEDVSLMHGATLRDGVVLAPGVKIGHSTEVKHSLLLEQAKAPHFNYVGDSILGNNVNLGAGVKLANFHALAKEISIEGQPTGLRKFGAVLGDNVSIGCNVVLSPGTLIGKNSIVYSGAVLRGSYPANSIIKLRQQHDIVARHDVTTLEQADS